MTYITANPLRDAERWEDDQEALADRAEQQEAAAFEAIKDAFIEGLQWGADFNVALPKNMAKRSTSEAIYKLADSGRGDLIDQAVCLLANINDPGAKALIQEMGCAYAKASMKEWRRAA